MTHICNPVCCAIVFSFCMHQYVIFSSRKTIFNTTTRFRWIQTIYGHPNNIVVVHYCSIRYRYHNMIDLIHESS
jgi:hypothetical protein